MYTREDIIEDFRNLQMQFPEKQLTRSEYRKDGQYSTSLIEKMFGSWTKFVNEVGFVARTNRHEIERDFYGQRAKSYVYHGAGCRKGGDSRGDR